METANRITKIVEILRKNDAGLTDASQRAFRDNDNGKSFDLDKLIVRLGGKAITEEEYNIGKEEGKKIFLVAKAALLKDDDGTFVIIYKAGSTPEEQAVIKAHEIGHFCLQWLHRWDDANTGVILSNFTTEDNGYWKELEANSFAAHLLITDREFIRELNAVSDEIEVNIEKLAKRLGVTEDLVLRRNAEFKSKYDFGLGIG